MGGSLTLGAGGGGCGQRGTGACYLAVIKSASTSSPIPSTSTTSASSYFCTVLEHKVTWEEKGDKLLFRKTRDGVLSGGEHLNQHAF